MSLNKAQLADQVSKETGIAKSDVETVIKASIDAISKTLAAGEAATFIGFGTFSVKERAARVGKNPRTGEVLHLAAKKVAKFKPGKALSDMVDVKPVEPAKKAPKKAPAKKK